ncbi:MAG: hypothetical protein A4S09_01905 [Proteobacteria bacterium SG_bin7]|nr:MAG: hypothetical protein A4S09_01905 [Proteobacteria bacterium SG_bin7]
MPRDGFQVGETVELYIESLAFQGLGVGKKDGFVFFVDETSPGDKILAKISSLKKNFGYGYIEKLIEKSNSRTEALCPHFSFCGGCQWQHVKYEEQIFQKEKILAKTLSRPTVKVIPSPNQYGYRNRIRLHWNGEILGMYQRKSSTVFPIETCKIVFPGIANQFEKTRERLKREYSGKPKQVDLFLGESGVINTQITNFDDREYPPFSQVNFEINEQLKKHVTNLIPSSAESILDLYCGSGNFTYLAKQKIDSARVIGVEFNTTSIQEAKKKYSGIEFFSEDVGKFLKKWKETLAKLTVIIDPPRTGCHPEVLDSILKLSPRTIIYVSCDPMTLKRDIQHLQKSSGGNVTLENALGFDMFPQTYHVETVAVLNSSSY